MIYGWILNKYINTTLVYDDTVVHLFIYLVCAVNRDGNRFVTRIIVILFSFFFWIINNWGQQKVIKYRSWFWFKFI